jgi:hypothetical protein
MESCHDQLTLARVMQVADYLDVKHAHHPLVRNADGEKLAKTAAEQHDIAIN